MNTTEKLVRFFEDNRGAWISVKRLSEEIGAEDSEISPAVSRLALAGYLVNKKKNYLREKGGKFLVGIFSSIKGGGGFFIPADGEREDIFVPSSAAGGAMNGDLVICGLSARRGKAEGSIVLVVRRRTNRVAGIISDGYLLPFGGAPPVALDCRTTAPNSGVAVVELDERTDDGLKAEKVESVGDPFDVLTPIKAVEISFGLARPFSREAEDEALRFGYLVKKEWTDGRRDFRDLPTVTIDPSDAKDFDDAISVRRNDDGGWSLFVHIADVSFFVKEDGSLDREARTRGNSVYLPGKVYPMLPAVLSDGLCSLNEDQDRLCLTCEMSIDPSGLVKRALFFESVIRSAKRLSYEEAEQIIEGKGDHPEEVSKIVLEGHRLAELLSAKRSERGSLDFDLPEPFLQLGPEGALERILPLPRLRSHRLIEEFMLLANASAAEFLKKKKRRFIYRIHEEPDEEKLKSILPLLNNLSLGSSFGKKAGSAEILRRAIRAAKGKPFERLVSYQVLRAMMRARYSEEEAGHYGLALSRYCHFTSPIRRYPDLVVHRAVKEAIAGTAQRDRDLEAIAAHASETERLADEAERETVEWITLIYLKKRLGDDFSAMITGFTKFGVRIELTEELIEGICPFSFMEGDHFVVDKSGFWARGKYTSRTLKVGQIVSVKLAKIDLFNREAQFAM